MPVFRIRLPLPSLAFDTPYCAIAEVQHAKMQKIASVNLMCPRLYSGHYNRSGCRDMHPPNGASWSDLDPCSVIDQTRSERLGAEISPHGAELVRLQEARRQGLALERVRKMGAKPEPW